MAKDYPCSSNECKCDRSPRSDGKNPRNDEHDMSDGPIRIHGINDSIKTGSTNASVSQLLGTSTTNKNASVTQTKTLDSNSKEVVEPKGSTSPTNLRRDRTTPKRSVLKSRLAEIIERYGDQLVNLTRRGSTAGIV